MPFFLYICVHNFCDKDTIGTTVSHPVYEWALISDFKSMHVNMRYFIGQSNGVLLKEVVAFWR